jgi:tetratricopeptide (TPR) repeat protein
MEELTLAEVQRVANAFPDIQGGVSAKRATGSLLTWVENDKAAEYLTEAFDEFPADSSKDKFCSGWLLSYALENLDKRQEAVETIDKALAVLPANWKEDSDFSEWVIWVLHEKADLLNYLDKGREAIDAYNESRAVNPNNTIGGWCLESMRAILTPSNDPEGKRLLDMLRSWTVQERREFLDWVLRLTRSEAIQAVCRAVKMNNDEGMEFLNEIITDYEHSRPAKSAEIIFLHSELAGFYGHVIGDKKKAKKMYKDVLTTKIKEEDLEKLQSTLYTSRMELANIIFSEFLSSADPKEKTNLLEDMKKLPATSFAEEVEQDLDQSQVGVMLAIMLRTLGPAVEYHRHMQKVFQKCVDGLRDADGWNDGSSFRLLAKALAVMGGLERDVSIAMSCQFSLVSPDPAKSDGTSSESSENGDETSAAAQAEEADKPGDIGNLAQNDPTEETGVEGSLKPESTGESQNATTTPALNGSAEETPDQIESIIEKTTTTTFTIMTNDPNFAPDTTADASEDTEELQASDPPSASTNPVEPSDPTPSSEVLDSAKPTEPDNTGPDNPKLTLPDDEELEPTAWVGCDGDCGTAIESWETPMYYCIICACVDLCTSCHRKRLAQNLGAPSDSWKPYCGKDHKYIKGPMATWKGVKGGVMRIGNEEIPFKEWLKDLEEKRWKDAWTDFWKGGGGVKDIGF